MTVRTYAIVENGVVVNSALWDGESEWSPEVGEAVLVPEGLYFNIGWLYDGSVFTDPNAEQLPSNADLLKRELSSLSLVYQKDIEELNRSWLAAAVSDGAKEDEKKNAVLEHISVRKIQYSTDRVALISLYSS